ACREGAQWRREGVAAAVGVTLGADQLDDGTAVPDVAFALESSGLAPDALHVGVPVGGSFSSGSAAQVATLGRLGVSLGAVGVRSWPLPPEVRPPATHWIGLDRELVGLLAELPAP